ncbi:hypothetical protein DM02DRAFT_630424 [Periconia macrospinosa]|uniref:Uncharacterized protein n=1 Tax=Periconia macrospinosa TaxID=97972 RepID=A0A2V1DM38_9PLEO|nr:hypothetical protein DM02DRAFT_630424 [Periconia macrospinosa]
MSMITLNYTHLVSQTTTADEYIEEMTRLWGQHPNTVIDVTLDKQDIRDYDITFVHYLTALAMQTVDRAEDAARMLRDAYWTRYNHDQTYCFSVIDHFTIYDVDDAIKAANKENRVRFFGHGPFEDDPYGGYRQEEASDSASSYMSQGSSFVDENGVSPSPEPRPLERPRSETVHFDVIEEEDVSGSEAPVLPTVEVLLDHIPISSGSNSPVVPRAKRRRQQYLRRGDEEEENSRQSSPPVMSSQIFNGPRLASRHRTPQPPPSSQPRGSIVPPESSTQPRGRSSSYASRGSRQPRNSTPSLNTQRVVELNRLRHQADDKMRQHLRQKAEKYKALSKAYKLEAKAYRMQAKAHHEEAKALHMEWDQICAAGELPHLNNTPFETFKPLSREWEGGYFTAQQTMRPLFKPLRFLPSIYPPTPICLPLFLIPSIYNTKMISRNIISLPKPTHQPPTPLPLDHSDPNHPHFPHTLEAQTPPTTAAPHPNNKKPILWSILALLAFGLVFTSALFTGKKLGSKSHPPSPTSLLTTTITPNTTTSRVVVTEKHTTTLSTSIYTTRTNTSISTVPTTQTVFVTSVQVSISTTMSVSVSVSMAPPPPPPEKPKEEEDPKCLPMGTWPSIEKCNKLSY